ncbi:hypothetical protein VNO77_24847 [Canavalia gladiata]|uniref:Uncharacterized protein n=1 Tax=Canavalia gladiata TaxID=3824 RepID=A0AAN9QD37_CANGL
MASSSGKPLRVHSLKRSTKHAPKPSLMLKDYLRDDLSSSSSSGFKSFPRRQCCTTVGFRGEKDLQLQRKRRNKVPRRRHGSSSFSTILALQRASEAVMKAIKSLPLSQKTKAASGVLSRSFSRKLLSRSFWRKVSKEEGHEGVPRRRRRSFGELIMQDEEGDKTTSLSEYRDIVLAAPSVTTSSGCDGNSWGESEFTFASTVTSSETSNDIDLIEPTKEATPRHKIEGVTITDCPNEKEQFSPVSILDCPFEDEEFYKSQFSSTSTTGSFLEGTKDKHMQKRHHFESVASLEPVVLDKRFAWSEQENAPLAHSIRQCSVLVPVMRTGNGNSSNMRHKKMEENVEDLVNFFKRSIRSNCLIMKAENLMFDYLEQSIEENEEIDNSNKLQICKVGEDWIHGEGEEVYLGWEEERGRWLYIREMEKFGEWKYCTQETQQLVLHLQNDLFADLVNELVLDLTPRASD